MKIEQVKKIKEPIKRLLYWIKERESIRLKKEAGEPRPWTDDEILQSYRFCNVRRMDDKVSQWLMSNWYEPYYDHPSMPTAIALARQFNKIETLSEIGFPTKWNPLRTEKILNDRITRGVRNFSAAYVITGSLGGPKLKQVIYKVIDPLHKNKPEIDSDSMEVTHSRLIPYAGFSSFMAGQFVADLRHAMSGSWLDRSYFAPVGPGSARGMNRVHGRALKTPLKQSLFILELTELISLLEKSLPLSITCRMEAMDYQNCLCEFDKMERTLWENRRPKQLYRGTEE